MSNAPLDSSSSSPFTEVDELLVVPVDSSAKGEVTFVRRRDEVTIENDSTNTDAVTAGAETNDPSFSQMSETSSTPLIATFRSERGIVPLTGIERLQKVSDQLQNIDAPGILRIQSVDILEDGCRVVMSSVSGATLEQLLQSRRPSWLEALPIAVQLTEALIPVHEAGLAHGCLNPARIFLQNQQLTKIADFGLCLVSDELSSSSDNSPFACIAPENVGTQRFPLMPQTDVYGIGVMLYRLICGRYPFRADSPTEMQRQIREDAPQPPRQLAPEIPSELEQLCLRCLSKLPADRPASARELWKPLSRLLVNHENAAQQSASDSLSLSESQRLAVRRPDSVRRVMLIQSEPRDGLLLETVAATLDRLGIQPVSWSGDGLLFPLPHSMPNSDWTVSFSDRVVRCLRAIAKKQKRQEAAANLPAARITLRATSARLRSQIDHDIPVTSDAIDRQVLQLQATIVNGSVEVCSRGYELLVRSLNCDQSTFETESSDTGRFRIADRDGETLTVQASRVRNLLPLSGRNSQFAMLKSRWEQACEGMGQVVLLIGDEGMGKTRIVQELVSQVTGAGEDGKNDGRTIVWGCRPYQQGQSLHPLLYWLRHNCEDFDDQNGDAPISTRIAMLLKSADTAVSEAARVLGSELGVRDSSYRQKTTLSATQRRSQSCQVLLDWLKGQAKHKPLLFVVEDLQWVDPATLNFLTLLVDSGFSDRIMTLLTFRPEFETPWGSRAHQTQVALNRLTKRHAKSLIEAASGRRDVPLETVEHVLKQSDGIPLYIEADATNPASDLFHDAGQ